MKTALAVFIVLLCWLATPAIAHRLDEYLQATTFAVEKDHVTVRMHLTPGVEVFGKVIASIDTNGDGIISEFEQQAYAKQVCGDLSFNIDGRATLLRLVSSSFPTLPEMRDGLGEIQLSFEAAVPAGIGNRMLTFANHHQSAISVYLANCLIPNDPDIHIISQNRSYDQSLYELNYTETVGASTPANSGQWVNQTGGLSLFKAFVYHGIHHILTGYDHLLFVSALVLAATSLWDLIKVVSAFTLAHTLTLTMAALNLIHVSERIVEPLIALSIVFVAVQNVFWPKTTRGWTRMAAAFFFGLFHGLGFAGGLLDAMREMQSGTMFLAILAFSIGVEAGHQLVVLPLFGLLKIIRESKSDVVTRTMWTTTLRRFGSTGISLAGMYYLCIAIYR